MAIHYTQDGPVVTITIDRPEARNSLDLDHFKWMREAWERFGSDDSAWVAIVTGVGDAFCVGADLKRYIPAVTALSERAAEEGVTEIDGYRMDDGVKAVLRGVELYKPIIAAVNGVCVAGGMEMLGGVDIRVASTDATFAVMEPKRGLFAGGGTTVRLPRQIGWAGAMELLLCADQIPAAKAYEYGLLNAVVEPGELMDAARAYAERIAANAPLAVQATKRSALENLYLDDDLAQKVRSSLRQLAGAVRALAEAGEVEAAQEALLATADELDGLTRRRRRAKDEADADYLAGLRRTVRGPFENESDLSSWIFRTDDAKEGPKAFAEKRTPNWTAS